MSPIPLLRLGSRLHSRCVYTSLSLLSAYSKEFGPCLLCFR